MCEEGQVCKEYWEGPNSGISVFTGYVMYVLGTIA